MGVVLLGSFGGKQPNNCKSTPAPVASYLVEEVEPLAEGEKKKKPVIQLRNTLFFYNYFSEGAEAPLRMLGGICLKSYPPNHRNPCPPQWVGGPLSFSRKSWACQLSHFWGIAKVRSQSNLQPERASCPTSVEPHFHPSLTLPETLQQDWLPIRALHCWRTGSGRTANWGASAHSTSATHSHAA